MLGLMQVELQTTCSALGYQEGDVYHKEPDCLETVKDLIRFLKREDESCDIRRQLGGAQIVQNDLVPILKQYKDECILWETVIRLMVNLTQPAILCFQNHMPEDKASRNYYLEIESYLQNYKEAFADEELFAVITKKLGDLLQLDWERRQEEDRLLIERILILVRNILHVPPNVGKEQRTDDDASVHDQVVWAIHVSGLEDLLLYLSSSDDERQFSFHVLEIIALMFREQTPEQLASAGVTRSLSERQKDERELEIARERERAQKRASIMRASSRHSRFGGTFVVSNVKSISERELITHRPIADTQKLSFDKDKVPHKRPKNRRPLTEAEYTRRSTLSIRLVLKQFCTQFVENCYNPLMAAVKDTLMRAGAQDNDETYYLWTMRFFMEFQRRHNFRVDLVSETMSVTAFHYVQTNLTNYHEMLLTNKKEAIVWSRRMHLALRAYYELLQTLNMMDRSKEPGIRESAKVIKSNVFYMMEYRDVFLMLLKKFNETQQSRGFLRDLVDATHLFIKMLEQHCTKTGHMVVQKKKKKKRKQKPKQGASRDITSNQTLTPQDLEDLWDEISSDLSSVFQGRMQVPSDVLPFDAASEVDVEQQKADAMSRIQEAMRGHKAAEAVAIFRAAREVWPENDQFGRLSISPEDEFMALREVFFADLPRSQQAEVTQEQVEAEDNYDDDEEDEEMQGIGYETVDEQFNFKEFVGRFANPLVVRACTLLLANYAKNSTQTNHAVIKLLHRIGFDTGIIGLLFQASLFRVFQKLLNDPSSKTSHFKEMVSFAHHVTRKFFEAAATNNKIFVELFFFKNAKDAVETVEGYGSTRESVKGKVAWTEEQEQELRDLYECFQDTQVPGMDVVDHIMTQLTDGSKTRRQIIVALVHIGLIGSAKDLKRKTGSARPRGWREEEEMELRTLFDEHRESLDPVGAILDALTNKKSKGAVKKKLLELGLVSDLKELRKKRAPKEGAGKGRRRGKKNNDPWGDDAPVDDGLPTFSDSEDEREPDDSSDDSAPSSGESEHDTNDDREPMYVIEIRKAARKVVHKGKKSAIAWVQGSLKNVAEDREEDEDDESIPLVPVTEDQEDAMEDKDFKALLKRLSIKPPANEQERFWRVPGFLSPAELRSRAAALDNVEEGNAESTSKTPPQEDGGSPSVSPKVNSRKAALEALAKQKKKARKATSDGEVKGKRRSKFRVDVMTESDQSQSQSQPPGSGPSQPEPETSSSQSPLIMSKSAKSSAKKKFAVKKRVWNAMDSDSNNQSDEDRLVIADDSSRDSLPQPKRPRVAVNSDSSDDEPLAKVARTIKSREEKDSDDEPLSKNTASFPASALTMEPGSDSDVDDHVTLKKGVKRAAIIDSDDDE